MARCASYASVVIHGGVVYRCYRKSLLHRCCIRVYFNARLTHRWWRHDTFIALTEFGKQKLAEGGLPEDRIEVKANSVTVPHATPADPGECEGALYVGRLSEEKGVRTLIEAWLTIDYPLTIVGDGPLRAELEQMSLGSCFSAFQRRQAVVN